MGYLPRTPLDDGVVGGIPIGSQPYVAHPREGTLNVPARGILREEPGMSAVTPARHEVDSLPLDQFNVADPRLYQDDAWRPYFARLRREAPVHYCRGERVRPVLVGHEVQGHHDRRGEPRDLLLGGRARRDPGRGSAEGDGPAELHPHGPAEAHPQRRVVAPIVATKTSPIWNSPSASARRWCWTRCREARRSTGWIASPSS